MHANKSPACCSLDSWLARPSNDGSNDMITGWSLLRKKFSTDSYGNISHNFCNYKERMSLGRVLLSISLSSFIAPASVCATTSICSVWTVYVGVVLKDQGPEVLLRRFWGCPCFYSSLSLELRSPSLQWSWERENSSSINSRCRFFPIISMQSLGPISCLWGSWFSAPTVRKFGERTLITVFAFLLEHVAHKSSIRRLTSISLPHLEHLSVAWL